MIEIIKTIILGIIQGITEWLPISSTGHLILFNEFFKLDVSDSFFEMFLVVIQLGSILAVVLLFFQRLWPFKAHKDERKETYSLYAKILIASIPAGIVGILFDDKIDEMFYNSLVVAITLIVYGIIFILMENRKINFRIKSIKELTFKDAFIIGCFQMLALIPGTSRSGSTIIGATALGISRHTGAEFSFFMAIPAMMGASVLKIKKFMGVGFVGLELPILVIGFVVAFIVSIFAIKFLLNYIKKHDFKVFGYYRILLGFLIIIVSILV